MKNFYKFLLHNKKIKCKLKIYKKFINKLIIHNIINK